MPENQFNKKLRDILIASTSHGLPSIFRTERIGLKVMWFVLFLIGISIGVYTVRDAINSYLDFDVVTKIQSVNQIPAEFPDVTFIILRNQKLIIKAEEIESTFLKYKFNSLPLNFNDFDIFQDKFGYVSYKFGSQKSYTPGLKYGLNIIINLTNFPIKDIDKNCNDCDLDGLRIVIHDKYADPGYYGGETKSGFTLAPGQFNEVIIKKTVSKKLGYPHNNCIKINDINSEKLENDQIYNYILKSTNYSYKQTDCFDYCIGKQMLNYLNITNRIDNWVNVLTEFSNKSAELKNIYSKLIKGEITNICTPFCPLECDTNSYDVSISSTKISPKYNEYLKSVNISTDNLIHLNVYYDNLEYISIEQVAKMSFSDLISNIGGNLGLFIGISFLSFAEIIEILIEVLIFLINKNKIFTSKTNL